MGAISEKIDLAAENAYATPYANTSILPLLLLSLMKQKNAPKTATTIRTEYDYIIVGAGSAGSVVASRLSEVPCVSVLLLEAGKSPPKLTDVPGLAPYFINSDLLWPYKTVPQKHTAKAMVNNVVDYPTGKTLGGSSTVNGMYYVRGNRKNYDDWAEQGAVGWSYSDVKPYFLKAEDNKNREFLADGYHVAGGPLTVTKQTYRSKIKHPILSAVQKMGYKIVDNDGYNQTGFSEIKMTVRNGQRCSAAKAYLVPAENRTNLDILTRAFVRKIIIQKGSAVGVQLDHANKTYFVRAKREVIMSAGTIKSTQLLMLSGIGPKEHLQQFNIPVAANLKVGANVQDHAGTTLFFEMNSTIPTNDQTVRDSRHIEDYIKNRKGPLASTSSDALAFLTTPTNPKRDFPDYQLYFYATPATGDPVTFGIKPEIIKSYFKGYENSTIYACTVELLQPKSRGTIKLQSIDPYDTPLIDPNFLADKEDIKTGIEGLKTCQRICTSKQMRKAGVKPLFGPFPGCEQSYGNDDLYFECLLRMVLFPSYHIVGTMKMGDPNDPNTIVDPRLRVKGIAGLRVVDASVMPIIPSGNTNVPTIMIAEKASDMIKDTIDCYSQTTV